MDYRFRSSANSLRARMPAVQPPQLPKTVSMETQTVACKMYNIGIQTMDFSQVPKTISIPKNTVALTPPKVVPQVEVEEPQVEEPQVEEPQVEEPLPALTRPTDYVIEAFKKKEIPKPLLKIFNYKNKKDKCYFIPSNVANFLNVNPLESYTAATIRIILSEYMKLNTYTRSESDPDDFDITLTPEAYAVFDISKTIKKITSKEMLRLISISLRKA